MLIIFDLDGTLIDSSRDLALATNATRTHFGLPPLDQGVVNSYVGNGAAVLVRRAVETALSEEQVAEALSFFLKYYQAHAMDHTRLYPGMRELVEELASTRIQLGVLTNKPEAMSFDILRALGLERHFFRVYGGNTFHEKKPHPAGILRLREEAGVSASATLMVGDSSVDVETARNAGVPSCGVTWGFQPHTFQAVPPDFLIHEPRELLKIVNGT
ncbi:MAG: HAD-IA family hydrolase [Acidobacteriaceae bacterium]|nr:HAD-IA family hydrolase [Acidobacteriaceae bacterium]